MKNNKTIKQSLLKVILFVLSVWVINNNAQNNWDVLPSCMHIISMAQEPNYVWVGTTEGLVKIDKISGEYKNYNSKNSELPIDYIKCISIDENNVKWIGTTLGLVKIDTENWSVYDTTNSDIKDNFVHNLACEKGKGIWVGSGYNGLSLFDGVNWTNYNKSNSGLPDDRIRSLTIDQDGNKWIGSFRGLTKFDEVNWITYNMSNSKIPHDYVKSIAIDSTGNKWIASAEYVTRFSGSDWKTWANYAYDDNVEYITCDRDNNIWVGDFGGGLSVYDGVEWKGYRKENSDLPEENVKAIVVDENNVKWIGTKENGVVKFKDENWSKQKTGKSEIVASFGLTTLFWGSNGNMWIGSYSALTKYDKQNWTNYNSDNTDVDLHNIVEINEDIDKIIWIAMEYRGLAKFDGTNWVIFNTSNSEISDNTIMDIIIDKNNIIWIATENNGISTFNGIEWQHFNTSNSGINSDQILSIAIDENDNKWISTQSGLMRYDGTNWTSINSDVINEVIIDSDGNKWLRFSNKGIAKYDGVSTIKFTKENSDLPSNEINSFVFDNSGDLWIGSDKGLTKFDGTNWITFNYDNSEMLHENVQSIAVDEFNNKWFWTYNGLVVYNETGIVSVENDIIDDNNELPKYLYLGQNYPNPFNPTTTIEYKLPEAGKVVIDVFDLRGRLVKQIINGYKEAGNHTIKFNGSNLASGLYIYRLEVNGFVKTKKMLLVK